MKIAVITASALAFATVAQANMVNAPSSDGSNNNLYQILGFTGNNPEAANDALNNAILNQSGGALDSWTMPISGGLSTFIAAFAGNAYVNTFGIYGVNAQGTITTALLPIFAGVTKGNPSQTIAVNGTTLSVGNSHIDITGDTSLGFYLYTGSLNTDDNLFYSTAGDTTGLYHVAVFNSADTPYYKYLPGGSFIMGWEDETMAQRSDLDYQDLILSITPVPEPTTIVAGAMLLLPFGMSTLRMFRKSRTA